jgi:serine/threonine-protein kinase
MGSVWRAWHETLHIPVAVKFIDAGLADESGLLQRFATEASAAAKIRSPHVVQMLDHGLDEFGRPYIAMELLEGESLQALLDRRGTMPLAEVVKLVNDVAKALAKAHAANVVHRDIKPENIFICPDDDGFIAKVLDFGIAKSETPVGLVQEKTRTGTLLGTPLYMSPEQALGRGGIDSRSDLYSLAVVAFRALTGEVPFVRQGLGELIVAIVNEAPASVSSLAPGTTLGVDQWFKKALAKRPDDRFANAKEMAAELKLATNSTLTGGHYAIDLSAAPKLALPDAHGNLQTLPSNENVETILRTPEPIARTSEPIARNSEPIEPTVKSADHERVGPESATVSSLAPAQATSIDTRAQGVTNPGLSLPSDPKQIVAPPSQGSLRRGVLTGVAMLAAALVGAGIVYTQMLSSNPRAPEAAVAPTSPNNASATPADVASTRVPTDSAPAHSADPMSPASIAPSASAAPAAPSARSNPSPAKPAPRPTSHATPIY